MAMTSLRCAYPYAVILLSSLIIVGIFRRLMSRYADLFMHTRLNMTDGFVVSCSIGLLHLSRENLAVENTAALIPTLQWTVVLRVCMGLRWPRNTAMKNTIAFRISAQIIGDVAKLL